MDTYWFYGEYYIGNLWYVYVGGVYSGGFKKGARWWLFLCPLEIFGFVLE